MSSQQMANLHNTIRRMNTEQLINVLEQNALTDCCDAIRCRQIDGDAFLNLSEGQLMFWRNILNRTQITRLWSVVQLAQERPHVFIPSDITIEPIKKPTAEEFSTKPTRKIASPITNNLNSLLSQQFKNPDVENVTNSPAIINNYDLPPRRPPNLKLPPKPASFNPPVQVPVLSTDSDILFTPPIEIPVIQKTETVNKKLVRPQRLPSPHRPPLPEPPKDIPTLPPELLTPTTPNESTLHSLRQRQEVEKQLNRSFNDFPVTPQLKVENVKKPPSPINPATRPLPELPKEESNFVPPKLPTERALPPLPKPLAPQAVAFQQAIRKDNNDEEDLAEYDYVDDVLISYTKERWFKDVTRREAKELLLGKPDGTFVIRPGKAPSICSISVICKGRVYNLTVPYKDGKVILGQTSFRSVQELVQHYSETPLVIGGSTNSDVVVMLKNV